MLSSTRYGDRGPLTVMLHWLGGSANTWGDVGKTLAIGGMMSAALDLPGFGRESDVSSHTVDETSEAIIATIQSLRGVSKEPWLLAGHSMGGKFAAIIARAAVDGRAGLENLTGVVLVSPSPPGPEPMSESGRQKMIETLGNSSQDEAKNREHAETFVNDNTGKLPLVDAIKARAVNDVLMMNRKAFVAWLSTGSKENWSTRVGVIPLPALIVAGTEESDLNMEAQRTQTLPHFRNAKLVPLEGGGHLAPLERPVELADRIVLFAKTLGFQLHGRALSHEFQALIDSDSTSQGTKSVLTQRIEDDSAGGSGVLSEDELITLRAAASRILPGCSFDLASRIDRWLALPEHDGWRHDTLPPDAEAWQIGLRSLSMSSVHQHGVPFSALDASRQDALLSHARDGKLGKTILGALHTGEQKSHFTASQMGDWFGDLHAELVKRYMADPRTMDRIGFTGFADEHGFTQIRLNQREDFER